MSFALLATISSCKKDGNPNNLPGVNPADYEGKIDGYKSSDEIYPKNLVAYWNFEDSKNEVKSGIAPTSSSNDSFFDAGVKGKALRLNGGYIYYGTQFPQLKTDSLKSFTISQWVQILNNGSKRTMAFQLARPGVFNGNINLILNTNSRPATNVDELTIQPTFTAINRTSQAVNMQDNLNAAHGASNFPFLSPKIGADKWTHIVITYDGVANNFQIWADGVKIGVPAYQNRGQSFFNSFEPSEVIIGSNYNGIPEKKVSEDVSFAPMTGSVDEIRVYNVALPDAHIKALHNLGRANK